MRDSKHVVLLMCLLMLCCSMRCEALYAAKSDAKPQRLDIDFLEYLGSLDEHNGEWFGPEQMSELDAMGKEKSSLKLKTDEQKLTNVSPETEEK